MEHPQGKLVPDIPYIIAAIKSYSLTSLSLKLNTKRPESTMFPVLKTFSCISISKYTVIQMSTYKKPLHSNDIGAYIFYFIK